MKHKKTVANIFQCHWSRDGKIDIDFFDFLGVFHRFCIDIRIEVHFFCLHLGNERTLVAVKYLRSAKRFTRDQCPFISQMQTKKCTLILKWTLFVIHQYTTINLCVRCYFQNIISRGFKPFSNTTRNVQHTFAATA